MINKNTYLRSHTKFTDKIIHNKRLEIISIIKDKLGNDNFKDINSKPKAFTREAYDKMTLTSDDWFIDAEIMINARANKFKIGTFPICFYKSERESFVKPVAILEFMKNLINFRLKK